MASDLLLRNALSTMLGLTYGGKRDLYGVFGYKQKLIYADFVEKYSRQDLAKRIVDSEPKATWITGISIDGGNEFNEVWESLVEKYNIWQKLERVDKLAGIGQFAVLLLGFSKGTLEKQVSNKNELIYLQPYGEGSIKVNKLEEDSSNPRFGRPVLYTIDQPNPRGISGDLTAKLLNIKKIKVHHSRILHVAENCLEDEIRGTPRMQVVFNRLDDLEKVVGGSAETFWLAANKGLHIDIDKEMTLDKEDEKNLSDEIEEYQHQLRRIIRTRGVDINDLGGKTIDPKGVFDVIIGVISGASGIPRRILLGAEIGQLSSEQDRANWADRINERIVDFAQPVILKPFISQLVGAGVLPEPESLTITWGNPFSMSPLESAQRLAQLARAVTNFQKSFKDDPVLTKEEIRKIFSDAGIIKSGE